MKGPLKSFSIVMSINREKGILRRFTVFSQGKRTILHQFLLGKLLWDELNSFEIRVFWSLPEITTDLTTFLSLKALAQGVEKKVLRKRLENGGFLGLKFISRQKYLTLKGRVDFFFLEETITLRRTPKYSGYTKHYRDKGSLGGATRDIAISEIFEPFDNVSEEIILKYLTVGEISLFGGVVFHPEEILRRTKRKDYENEKQTNAKNLRELSI